MAELDKNRSGLQKPVSSVFKGVPMPPSNGGNQTPGSPAPERAAGDAKPMSTDHATSASSLMTRLSQAEEQTDTNAPAPKVAPAPKPPAASEPKPQDQRVEKAARSAEPPEKAAPVEQPEDEIIVEDAGPGLVQTIKDKLFAVNARAGDPRQKAMVVLIPILAIIMIFMFRQVLSKSPNKTKGAAKDKTPAVAASNPNEINWKIPDPLPAIMRDPLKFADQQTVQNSGQDGTTDGTAAVETTGTINIRDIVYSKDKPSAVVGDHIVYVGDKVRGATILKITRDSVEFEKDGKTWVQTIRD